MLKLKRLKKGRYQTSDEHGRFQVTDISCRDASGAPWAKSIGPRWLVFDLFTGYSFEEYTLDRATWRINRLLANPVRTAKE